MEMGIHNLVMGPRNFNRNKPSEVPSQQMGFSGGASQAGMSYGTRRQIHDPNVA